MEGHVPDEMREDIMVCVRVRVRVRVRVCACVCVCARVCALHVLLYIKARVLIGAIGI